jgi:transcriptional regulator with XRE-family HTH domain
MTHLHGRPLNYYLRSYRRHAHLTQAALAYLLGASTGVKVSRYESGKRTPSLETGLAYEAALGVPICTLFRGRCEEIAEKVAERRRRLEAKQERRRQRVGSAFRHGALDAASLSW